jgi:uncharacterized protein (DUF1800 family)
LNIYSPDEQRPWDSKKINFLSRRLGFGCSLANIESFLSISPSEAVDQIINNAKSLEVTRAPEWAFWSNKEFNASPNNKNYYNTIWQKQAFKDLTLNGFRDRLTLFWSNHFVVEYLDFNQPAYLYQYYNLLQTNCLGNFKNFVSQIGLTPAMLRYLNGFENKKNSPNENYARELYELFTLGEGNGYTQEDITETSRALTGFNKSNSYGPITFNNNTFDEGEKIIFGEKGNWGYNDVINILFEQKKNIISEFICTKIYRYFVNPDINEAVIAEMKTTFIDNDFELIPVFSKLFKSDHFFETLNSNVIIKSPIDLMVGLHESLNFQYPVNFDLELNLRNKCRDMGQTIFSPIDVAGWQGNHSWINSESLPNRWEFADLLLRKYWANNKYQFKKLAIDLVGKDETDVNLIVLKLKDFIFCTYDIKPDEMSDAINIFKGEVPENYFEDGTWSLNNNSVQRQVYDLLRFFIGLPEFQLK